MTAYFHLLITLLTDSNLCGCKQLHPPPAGAVGCGAVEWLQGIIFFLLQVRQHNEHGSLGLVSMRMVLREYSKAVNEDAEMIQHSIDEFMIKNPITIHPEASIMEAMTIMQEQKIGCLPVVKNSRLVGIITEDNFMNITRRLLTALAREKNEKE